VAEFETMQMKYFLIIEVSQKSCRHVLSDKGYDSACYVLRASPVVFNILHYTIKLDEEKSNMLIWLSKMVLAQHFCIVC